MHTTPSPVPAGISAVRLSRPWWRCALLFQSWPQFQSWALLVAATAALLQSAVILAGGKLIPVEGMLLGMAIGSLAAVAMVLPARFTVAPATPGQLPQVVAEVEGLHYAAAEKRGAAVVYHQRLPRFLRWDEGNITVSSAAGHLIIEGPVSVLKKVRAKLIKSASPE